MEKKSIGKFKFFILFLFSVAIACIGVFFAVRDFGAVETADAATNAPVLNLGKAVWLTQSSAANDVYYSNFTSSASDSKLNATLTKSGNSFSLLNSANNMNAKLCYYDFNATIVVPAWTRYVTTYNFSYSCQKSGSGTAPVAIAFFRFSDVNTTAGESYYNGETLHAAGKNIRFYRDNADATAASVTPNLIKLGYLKGADKKVYSGTCTVTATYTNMSGSNATFRSDFGVYSMVSYANSASNTFKSDVTLTSSSSVETDLRLPAPTKVTATYNGQPLTLADVAGAEKSWYDSGKMSITYPAEMTNVGVKQVKATSTVSEGLPFRGTPGAGETETERFFDFEIKPKPISLNVSATGGGLPISASVASGLCGADKAPDFSILYESMDGAGYSDTTPPTKVGKYKATISISSTPCNYTLDKAYSVNFSVSPAVVTIPSISSSDAAHTYDGSSHTLTVNNYDPTKMSLTGITAVDGAGNPVSHTATMDGAGVVTFKETGVYTVEFALLDAVNTQWSDKTQGRQTVNFTVNPQSSGLTSYSWTYTTDGASPQAITSGNKLTYALRSGSTADGVTYELSVDESQFAANYIAIDTSKGTNGYDTRSASTVGTYTTTVYLKTVDNDHQFGNGTHSDTATISWEIEKGTFDVSGVKWESGGAEYTGALPWKGTNYTLTITPSSLPAGLAVRATGIPYSGNVGKTVGTYSARCNAFTYDAANFNAPSAITLSWEIEKAKIDISSLWLTDEKHTDGDIIFFTPRLDSAYNGTGIKYNYYKVDAGVATLLKNGVADIKAIAGTTLTYLVQAYVTGDMSTDNVNVYSDCIELINGSAEHGIDNAYVFETGDSRIPVSVTIDGNNEAYDGTRHDEVKITIGSSDTPLGDSDFTIKYYKFGTDMDDISQPLGAGEYPIDAGDYLIVVGLSSDAEEDYFLNASKHKFTITKADLDLSGAYWGYVDEGGNETAYTGALPYGLNSDGSAKEWELKLFGLPDSDTQTLSKFAITYTGNKASAVRSAPYTATYSFTYDTDNFDLKAPSTVTTPDSFDWRISTKLIAAPEDAIMTYNGDGFDLAVKNGLLSEEYGIYFTATVSVYDEINNVWNVVGSDFDITNVTHAGKYRAVYNLTDTENVKWLVGGNQSQTAQTADVTIEKLRLTLTGWDGLDSERKTPVFNNGAESVDDKYYAIAITDGEGNDASGSWMTGWNTTFTETLRVADDYAGDVEILQGTDAGGDLIPLVITFTVGDDPTLGPAIEIDKPTLKETKKEYTGKDITFEFDGYDSRYYDLYDESGNVIQSAVGKEVGKYKVYIKIRAGGNYKWKDTHDKSAAEYEYEIVKRRLPVVWGTTEDGKPEAKYPEGYDGPKDLYEYKYFDGEGNEVPESELAEGTEYRVGVRVKDEYAAVAEIIDADGNVVEISYRDETYTTPVGGFIGFMQQKFLFGLDMWIWFIIFGAALLLLILLIVLGVRHGKKKAAKAEAKAAAEAEERKQEREMRMMQMGGMPQMPMMGGMPQMQTPYNMQQYAQQSEDKTSLAELKAEIEKLRDEQRNAQEIAAVKAEAEKRAAEETARQVAEVKAEAARQLEEAKAEAARQSLESRIDAVEKAVNAKTESEMLRLRADVQSGYYQYPAGGKSMEAFGEFVMAALKQYNNVKNGLSAEEHPALPESNIVGNVVPGAITTTTTTTTVDASGSKTEEKSAVSGTVENIPNAEGLFNRRGRSKTDGYDPNNFYNFFDESEEKKD